MASRVSIFHVPAIASGEVIAAGCCPVPAAAAAVQILLFLDGVVDVEVDEPNGRLMVTHDDERVAPGILAEELEAIGLPTAAAVS